MPKQIINVGTAPGNMGDGDTLRDAFVKTRSNFDELYNVIPITNTSLDHDNPWVVGSIAKGLADAAAAGGGTVQLGPGRFICNSTTLTVGDNVRLKGAGRRSTIIEITGSQVGISMSGLASSVESLHLKMPVGAYSDGIKITRGEQHVRDLYLSGGGPTSWAINIDAVNIVYLNNIRMGGSGNALTGNGIIFQNTSAYTYNFGDSKFSKIDITLASNDTTGIMIKGPEIANVKINNILLSQIEVIGTGAAGGCVGVYLYNAARIVFVVVDLEELGTAIIEEGVVGNCRNNVYIATFAFGVGIAYVPRGNVFNRTFIGCQNIVPSPAADGDMMSPRGLWLEEGAIRLWKNTGNLQLDNGTIDNGVQINVSNTVPQIQPSSTAATAQLTMGRNGTRGVECLPGIVLPIQSTPIASPKEGTLAQFAAGVVGANAGLYQLRQGTWVFIN